MLPTILTVEGEYFDFVAPGPGISLEAIARGLSNICRFNGQCRTFYSVAEHSVWVSRVVPSEWALVALLHDAAEAFIGDVTKPLKNLLPDYQAIERRVECAIAAKFGLPLAMPEEVKAADRQMLWVEQRQIMNNRDGWHGTSPPVPFFNAEVCAADIELDCLTPPRAYDSFMCRAEELGLASDA